jgi:hypothetical protein
VNEGLDQAALRLSETFSVGGIDGDITYGSGAVVLNIDVGRSQKLDENRDGAGVDKLLSVVICIESVCP